MGHSKRGRVRAAVDRVDHAGAITARIISVARRVVLGVGDGLNQSVG